MNEQRIIDRIERDYNPDHDIGPDAPVNFYTYQNTIVIKALLERIEELERRVMVLEEAEQ